jgi:hypothetical protein
MHYDLDFFEEIKNTFLRPDHGKMFAQLNLTPDDFSVSHIKLI